MKWLLRIVWSILVVFPAIYVILPIIGIIGCIGSSIWNFKLDLNLKGKLADAGDGWQEVCTTPGMCYGRHVHYRNPFDFMLKRNPIKK